MPEDAGAYPTGGDGGAEREGEEEAARVRALRLRLGETQAEFAARLGTTQQTVSEWERGVRRPRRMALRLLALVAEQSGVYDPSDGGPPDGPSDGGAPPGAA